jgi:gliding motility-associated lipoprotein GldH
MKQFIFISLLAICSSCLPSNEFYSVNYLSQNKWNYNQPQHFVFNIEDTSAKYAINFLMQHGEEYGFSNIWLKMITKYPSGTIDTLPLEVKLAASTGQWFGTVAGGFVQHTSPITPNGGTISFSEKGKYDLQLVQNMRVNPLPEIQSVGLQLQKIVK